METQAFVVHWSRLEKDGRGNLKDCQGEKGNGPNCLDQNSCLAEDRRRVEINIEIEMEGERD